MELNFKRPIVTTHWHCVETSVNPLPAVTVVARLVSNCTLTDWLPHQPPPKLQLCPTNAGCKDYSLSLSLFNDIHFSNNFDSLFSTMSVFKLNKFALILHTQFSLIDRYRHFGLTYCLLLHGLKLEVKQAICKPTDSMVNRFLLARSQNGDKCLLNSQCFSVRPSAHLTNQIPSNGYPWKIILFFLRKSIYKIQI